MTALDETAALEEAEREAAKYIDVLHAHDGDVDALWVSTDASVKRVAESYNLESFVPDGSPALQFSGDFKGVGRAFYRSYIGLVRESLCGAEGDLRATVKTALNGGVSATIVALGAILAIPSGALLLIAPIVAVLLVKGIDAFCEATGSNSDPTDS